MITYTFFRQMFEIKFTFLDYNSFNIWRGVKFMKLNILVINSNHLLFSPSEVKIFASEPSFFSFNIIDQIQRKKQAKVFLLYVF